MFIIMLILIFAIFAVIVATGKGTLGSGGPMDFVGLALSSTSCWVQ